MPNKIVDQQIYFESNMYKTLVPALLKIIIFFNTFVSTDLCLDKTFGKTPARLKMNHELGHFFVKIHIFVVGGGLVQAQICWHKCVEKNDNF